MQYFLTNYVIITALFLLMTATLFILGAVVVNQSWLTQTLYRNRRATRIVLISSSLVFITVIGTTILHVNGINNAATEVSKLNTETRELSGKVKQVYEELQQQKQADSISRIKP